MTLSHFYESYSMSHTLLGHLQISFLAHTSSKKTSLHLKYVVLDCIYKYPTELSTVTSVELPAW